ncbi:hypothetical protein BDY19DRAFT_350963 [Irpex rosettiformis]|uniref:Uncharacterized protein n=1 Tax=Irpex rosettiformis TaxID=378272 RepID=A0ACB8TX03_9APHY|nr:hypothetical protein BDY19DRAFT_350963 [Irpex rosettiformis]
MPPLTINDIPEELLRQILKYEFYIDLRDTFSLFRAYFALRRTCKPSYLLLVCKHWLYVATPLFYETVELGTDRHVGQLAQVIRRNPSLGSAVRHLRIDGGYGWELDDIVQHMPHILTLSVQSCLTTNQSNAGLILALPRLNPDTLYFHCDWLVNDDVESRANYDMIWKAVANWTALRHIVYCESGDVRLSPEMLKAIATAPSLSDIWAQEWPLACMLREPAFCDAVLSSSITSLRCSYLDKCLDKFMARAGVPKDVKNLVVYESDPNDPNIKYEFFRDLRQSPSLLLRSLE